ncbi:hypothetical protein ACPA9J_03740 [Pseudomonas aeruginosa]
MVSPRPWCFLCLNWVILRSLEHHFDQQDAHELGGSDNRFGSARAPACEVTSQATN